MDQQSYGLTRSLHLPTWPDGAKVAVALTFDVDADPAWRGMLGSAAASRLGLMSQFRYGIVRGLPRILSMLDRHDVGGTFFIPGATADAYPRAVQAIAAQGHEIGHHGHDHLPAHKIEVAQQRLEIERGLESLEQAASQQPVGYRAPFAELTPETLSLLDEFGFTYDSSCMGDDRPYIEEAGGSAILELPIDWRLDDAPFMLTTLDESGLLEHPGDVLRQWWEDFELAVAEGSLVTLVMHPEIMGRGSRLTHLERLIIAMKEHTSVWFPRLREVAALLHDQAIYRPATSGA